MRRNRRTFQRDLIKRQCAGEFAEIGINEYSADVILRQQDIDDPFRYRLVAIGYIDQIRAAIRRDLPPASLKRLNFLASFCQIGAVF
jgi:hypothetical protein